MIPGMKDALETFVKKPYITVKYQFWECIYHNIISKLFHGWNPLEIKLKSIPVFVELTVITLMFNAIAKYVKSKLQVSIMAAFWYLSDTDQCRIFCQDIWKTVKCPQVYLWDAFLPESTRDHRMEKHDGLLHIQVITLQIPPWKCV